MSLESSCIACPAERYTNATGLITCLLCPTGIRGESGAQPSNAMRCKPCSLGEECVAGVPRSMTHDIGRLEELTQDTSSIFQFSSPSVLDTTEPLPALVYLRAQPPLLAVGRDDTQLHESTDGEDESVNVFIYGAAGAVCLGTAAVLLLYKSRVKACLYRIDILNLKHPLRPREVMSGRPSFTGESFTVATLLAVLALLANAACGYLHDGNRESTMVVAPVAELPSQGTKYFAVVFYVYGDAASLAETIDQNPMIVLHAPSLCLPISRKASFSQAFSAWNEPQVCPTRWPACALQ